MTGDRGHVTGDMWHMTGDTWQITQSVGWTLSQKFSSLTLPIWDWQCLEDILTKGSLNQLMNQWVTEVIVQPATPNLLKKTEWSQNSIKWKFTKLFNRPGVAGGCSSNTFVIN